MAAGLPPFGHGAAGRRLSARLGGREGITSGGDRGPESAEVVLALTIHVADRLVVGEVVQRVAAVGDLLDAASALRRREHARLHRALAGGDVCRREGRPLLRTVTGAGGLGRLVLGEDVK